jgi:DNA polymerase V
MLALCDCNNFFVSCERLYHPELRGRPVVILSNNDGCIISRSNEVKAMGIPMGQPYFQARALLKKKGVVVCSGNLVLYREISEKVMQALGRFSDAVEKYSIDEAFLNFPQSVAGDPVEYAREIRRKVDRLVGIPVSVGVADTKTLAKLASEKAKKSESGVLRITPGTAKDLLDATPVGDVWGIGRKSAEYLNRWGIYTAGDFVRKDSLWVKKAMTVRGLMTQLELRGQQCLPLVTTQPLPKSIQVSRTWGGVLESHEDITRAMTDNVVKAGRLLRRDRLAAGAISVYMRYGYRHHGEYGYFTDDLFFKNPLLSDIELIAAARRLIDKIFRPGYRYTQGGVILCNFSEARFRQRELFDDGSYERRSKYERFSNAIDEINEHFGERIIYPAALAVKDKKWRPNRKHLLSPGLYYCAPNFF